MINSSIKAITVVDDLYTVDECSELISYFKSNQQNFKYWNITKTTFFPIVESTNGKYIDEISKKYSSKLLNIVSNVRPDRCHIELREVGTNMEMHFDTGTVYNAFTSVTYLNDDYEGGETIIRPHGENSDRYNTVIVPKVGRTVFYDGAYFEHAVSEVKGSNRFTMPMWYVKLPLDYPDSLKWLK